MNLSRKIILVIVSTFIALVFIVAATSDVILLNSFAKLEKKVLEGNVAKVNNEIGESFPELDGSAKDYAEQFRLNLAERITQLGLVSFANHRIDFIACFRTSGELISSNASDFHNRQRVTLSQAQLDSLQDAVGFYVRNNDHKPMHGFLSVAGNVAQLAIRQYDDDHVILVGKFLDHEEIGRVSELTKFVIAVSPVDANGLAADYVRARSKLTSGHLFYSEAVDDGQISGFTLFRDIFGKPVLLLKISEQRLIYQQGKVSIFYILLVLFISGAVFCSVMLLFMRGTVLNRLAGLNAKVGEISRNRDISERLEIHGDDELEDLACSINTMLDSLQSAELALKESEERYRALFERAPDSIIIMGVEGDETGRIISANSAAAAQHGYSIEELCSLRIQDLNTPEANLVAGELFERIINGEWVTSELWHYKKDGSRFPIEVHAGPVKIKGRNYVIGFDRDITSRKLAEESDRMYLEQISQLNKELGKKASELQIANKELESFNYSVSHDMRGPLTRISGYCQLILEDESLDLTIRTYLDRVYESSCWLDEMLEAMLKLSRLARADVAPEMINLSSLVEEVLNNLVMAEPARVVDSIIKPGVIVAGDAQLLKVLVDNLINNSWKYSAHKDRTSIEFGVTGTGGSPVYYVRDKGAGFDMKDADKLFRAFARLHDSATFSGNGIGLATAQRVVDRHGGTIWAEGEVGVGATFFFTLNQGGADVVSKSAEDKINEISPSEDTAKEE